MVHKDSFHVMTFETAKKAVDYLLSQPPRVDAVVWNFIGGEPTLEMELIDKITDYIKLKQYINGHPWHVKHMFFIGTNGVLYGTDTVQRFLQKNRNHVQFSITIDGTRKKHDLQRVRSDGSGSYDDVYESVKLWQTQSKSTAMSTKVTFSSEDIIYLKESVIHLWDIGITYVAANVVFEDVWKPGDAAVFYKQLIDLADYIIDNEIWDMYSVRFFDPQVGFQSSKETINTHCCGTGKMVAIDTEGNLYPCVRFINYCRVNKSSASGSVGDLSTGSDADRLRAFDNLSLSAISDDECRSCQISSGCFTCAGHNFDDTFGFTVFHRAKYNCEMQKAQVAANMYFWSRYTEQTGRVSPFEMNRYRLYVGSGWKIEGLRFIYILLSDQEMSFCNYDVNGSNTMSSETIEEALAIIYERNMVPVYIGVPDISSVDNSKVNIKIIDSGNAYIPTSEVESVVYVYSGIISVVSRIAYHADSECSCIYVVEETDIPDLSEAICILASRHSSVTINKRNFSTWSASSCDLYHQKLVEAAETINESMDKLSSSNPLLQKSWRNDDLDCDAGVSSFVLAPNGSIYPCPAFYYMTPNNPICHYTAMRDDLEKSNILYSKEKSPVCKECDNMICRRCVFDNWHRTGNINIPSYAQCDLAFKERSVFSKSKSEELHNTAD